MFPVCVVLFFYYLIGGRQVVNHRVLRPMRDRTGGRQGSSSRRGARQRVDDCVWVDNHVLRM